MLGSLIQRVIPWSWQQWNQIPGVGPRVDDFKFPATPDNINSAATRYRYDFTELSIEIDANARYDQEVIGNILQLPHAWEEGTMIGPHVHWLQAQAGEPNWLLQYRAYNNGATPPAWTSVIADSPIFTYTSGTILQITPFPDIDLSGITISGFVDMKVSRDTANGSTLFAGADPVAAAVHFKEFDCHGVLDSRGSRQEFIK